MAAQLGYRTQTTQRVLAGEQVHLLAMVVADITNPVFFGMIRGAERTALHAGYQLVLAETQESQRIEQAALERLSAVVDGVILASSRLPDGQIRAAAKAAPLVVLNRLVDQVPSVAGDNLRSIKKVVQHLVEHGHRRLTYLAGPEASWSDGMRWRGVLEAADELELIVRRIGPLLPTEAGGRQAAASWSEHPTSAVIGYNDLIAIGFIRTLQQAGARVPQDVSVVGFDNIRDAELIDPRLTSVALPLVSLGSAAVNHLLKTSIIATRRDESVLLPARVVLRDSVGPPSAR